MIYTFGDSFTYGFNFDEQERVQSVWPTILSNQLGIDVVNLAVPGGNNWQIARLINSMSITSSDIVIVPWTESTRFEFGVSSTHTQKPNIERPADTIDQQGSVRSKKFFSQIIERTNDPDSRKFAELAYGSFYNESWYEEMFMVMFNSTRCRLQEIGCQWLMFNTWTRQYHRSSTILEIPEYLLGYKNTMTFNLRRNADLSYWNKQEHIAVSSIICDYLNEHKN
jgi:hypothetical protein